MHPRAKGSYIAMSAADAAALRNVALHQAVAAHGGWPEPLWRRLAGDAGDPAELRVETLRVRAASRLLQLPSTDRRRLANPSHAGTHGG